MKIKKLLRLLPLFVVITSTLLTTFPQKVGATANDAMDEAGPAACKGLGLDVNGSSVGGFVKLTPDMFKVTILNRSEILLQPTNPGQQFFLNSRDALTFEDIFGAGGCIINDRKLDQEFTYEEPNDGMFTFKDLSNSSGGVQNQTNDLNDSLGVVTTSGLQMRLQWVFKHDNNNNASDDWIYWDDDDQEWVSASNDGSSSNGVLITNITDASMINYSLRLVGGVDDLSLVSTAEDDPVTFRLGELDVDGNGTLDPVLLKDISNPDNDFIAFPAGTTPQMLIDATSFVTLDYYDKPGSLKGQILVLGGKGQIEQDAKIPDEATGSSSAIGEGGDSCESVADFAFSFVLCPILALTDTAIGWLDDRIISALTIKESYYNNDQLKESWGNIRNVAYIILIPIMLVMVIGTALGGKFMDVYTVKRAMPRLVIAAIFITLSYDITAILVQLSNGVGQGIAGLIAAPFGGLGDLTLQDLFDPSALNNGLFVGGVLGGVAIAAFSGVTIWVLFSFVGMAALGMLLIFLILSVRELMVIFLMIISPIAILAWIFPGNDKPWKLWWSTFNKMLLLFPIVMGVFTSGRIFAQMTSDVYGQSGVESVVGTIVKLVAIIGPYFFIPKLFQMAGGALANVAGMVNDRGKGIFDRQRKFRENQRKGAKERIKSGNRFRNAPEGSRRATWNKRLQSGAQLPDAGFRPSRVRAAKRLHAAHELDAVSKDSGAMSTLANDDAANALMSGRGTRDDMIKYLTSTSANGGAGYDPKDAAQIADELMLLSRSHGVESMKQAAFIQLAGSKTAYRGGPAEMINAAYEAAGGDTQVAASLYAKARSAAEQAGRVDLAGYSYGEGLGEAQKLWGARAQGMDAAGVDSIAGGINNRLLNKVVDSKGVGAVIQSHGTAAKNLMPVLQQRLERATQDFEAARATGDYAGMEEAHTRQMASAAEIANTFDYVNYAAPEVARELRDSVMTQRISYTDTAYKEEDVQVTQRIQKTDPATGSIMYEDVPVMERIGGVMLPKMTKKRVEIKGPDGRPVETTRSMSTQEFIEFAKDDKDFRSIRREQQLTEEERRKMSGAGPI